MSAATSSSPVTSSQSPLPALTPPPTPVYKLEFIGVPLWGWVVMIVLGTVFMYTRYQQRGQKSRARMKTQLQARARAVQRKSEFQAANQEAKELLSDVAKPGALSAAQ